MTLVCFDAKKKNPKHFEVLSRNALVTLILCVPYYIIGCTGCLAFLRGGLELAEMLFNKLV